MMPGRDARNRRDAAGQVSQNVKSVKALVWIGIGLRYKALLSVDHLDSEMIESWLNTKIPRIVLNF